ncbi:MAG: GTP 3',8-cyclase MoaA [Thermodesulfovibrionales bacterium]
MALQDSFFRMIDYMRVSVTDRCNIRCVYCMPSEGIRPIVHKEIMTHEEILRVLRSAARLGVRKVRITGGEPLVRKNVQYLIREAAAIDGIEEITLTTNGILLGRYASELAACGLKRVNVSLDSLRAERYREITRGGRLEDVLSGIEAAQRHLLVPVKINMVPIRGLNDDEIIDFARMTVESPCHVRFIELMPFGDRGMHDQGRCVTTDEVKRIVSQLGELTPVRERRAGPAKYFRLPGAEGVLGFISSMTHHFCTDCNRLRMTADGKIRPCLFSETEIDLKTPMRRGVPDEEIERILRIAVEIKPEGKSILGRQQSSRPMSRIGG